jgi:predicted ribosomally synthesized peptide with SipW-like signal peptide
VRALLAGGLVLGVGATATIAAWTDQELATSTVTAGSFSIVSRVGGTAAFTAAGPSTNTLVVPLDAGALYPGQARAAAIQVKAGGTLGGTLNLTAVSVRNAADGAVTAPADVALQGALTLGVKVTTSTVAGAQAAADACTTSTTPDVSVTGIQNLPALTAATLTVDPQSGAANNIVTYCMVLTLPGNAPGTAQGGSLKPSWTFTGSTS